MIRKLNHRLYIYNREGTKRIDKKEGWPDTKQGLKEIKFRLHQIEFFKTRG